MEFPNVLQKMDAVLKVRCFLILLLWGQGRLGERNWRLQRLATYASFSQPVVIVSYRFTVSLVASCYHDLPRHHLKALFIRSSLDLSPLKMFWTSFPTRYITPKDWWLACCCHLTWKFILFRLWGSQQKFQASAIVVHFAQEFGRPETGSTESHPQ